MLTCYNLIIWNANPVLNQMGLCVRSFCILHISLIYGFTLLRFKIIFRKLFLFPRSVHCYLTNVVVVLCFAFQYENGKFGTEYSQEMYTRDITLGITFMTIDLEIYCSKYANFKIFANVLKQLCRTFCQIIVLTTISAKNNWISLLRVGWKDTPVALSVLSSVCMIHAL